MAFSAYFCYEHEAVIYYKQQLMCYIMVYKLYYTFFRIERTFTDIHDQYPIYLLHTHTADKITCVFVAPYIYVSIYYNLVIAGLVYFKN